MGQLEGTTAVITGARSGIGRAAYALAREGCNLVLVARREERLTEVKKKCEELGGSTVYYVGDVRCEQTAQAAVELAVSTFGKVDILINNAGIGKKSLWKSQPQRIIVKLWIPMHFPRLYSRNMQYLICSREMKGALSWYHQLPGISDMLMRQSIQ